MNDLIEYKDNLSTTETPTGRTFLGKPTYTKVVGPTTSATSNSSTYQKLNALISGYTDVQNVNYFLSATIVDSSTGGTETPPADISSGNMRIACDKIHPVGSYIIIEYTKSTD